MTTIVTAYYRFKKSKYSHQVYLDWMDNMLEIHTPMVIFTNEASKKYVIGRRVGLTHLTKIIILEQSEWLTYKYISQWEKHYELDHEKYHNVDLYMIWNEKSNFLKRAIELNQFNTEYFIWCDIGCFRDSETLYKYKLWPSTKLFQKYSKGKVLLLKIYNDFTNHDIENPMSFQYVNHIGGTIFGGCKEILLKWHSKFYETLNLYFDGGVFAGKDQSAMATLAIKYPEIVRLVKPNIDQSNQDRYWFHLQDLLSDFKQLKIAIIGPGIMPIPSNGWGACENLIWDYNCELNYLKHLVEIINEPNSDLIVDKINKLRPDVVHIQYDDHGHIANRIKDFTRIIILTTHYAYLEQEHRWGNWINIFNYALNLPENAYIFCLSEGIKNVYINHRINPDKIIVIHNGVREDLMKYKENPIYPDKSVYVGKIEQRKRQNLIKDNQSIDFVGNIQDRYFTSSDKNYLGEWNRKTLYKNLTSYSNLVLISDGEADPLVVKEALVAGLGLVLSKVSTANLDLSKPFIDVITENKIHDIDYVNKVIEENRIKSLKYRSDIRQYGLEKFSWENIILEKYIPSIYKLLE